jgi:hypothetical protein
MKMLEKNPRGMKKADIVVGIPSHNEAAKIAYPTEQTAIEIGRASCRERV